MWAGRAGDGDVLTQAVKELRRVFGDDLATPRFIETVPRLGYRLLASVEWDDSLQLATIAESDAAEAAPAPPAQAAETARGAARIGYWLVVAFAGLALMALTASLLRLWRGDGTAAAAVTGAPLMLTAEPGAESTPRLSPDGSRLAYVALDPDSGRQRVQVRGVNASTTLLPSEGAGEESWPVWSADGAQLAFVRHEGRRCSIVTVDALGGVERLRGDCAPGMFESFDWSPDGRSFAITSFDGPGTAHLALRAVEGGQAQPFDYAFDTAEHDLAPHYSPDGRHIAFRRGLSPYCDLYLVAATGGEVRRLTHLAAMIRGLTGCPTAAAWYSRRIMQAVRRSTASILPTAASAPLA